ncbi:hypothetical protein [Nocardioides ferulae]|uniref:hypothetical protein n=1 Tax=Nocardioides ferulae TaxID=2340821 RepID=UPI000EB2701C|nr:hypothetical protein [Nocardioides ferulae]
MSPTDSLQLRRPRWLLAVGAGVLAAVVALVAWWFLTHPPALPVEEQRITATTAVDQPVYLGVFGAPADFGRRLEVDGVKVRATSSAEVTLVPWLCQDGAPGVTTDPEAFCSALVDPAGAELGAGDSIVLEVRADHPLVVVVDRVRIGYRDGLRAATQEAGAPALVTVVGR